MRLFSVTLEHQSHTRHVEIEANVMIIKKIENYIKLVGHRIFWDQKEHLKKC